MAALVAYMRRRSEVVKDCKGEAGALAADGMQWYIPAGDAIPHLVVCEACYEEVVLATAPGFANRFTEHHTPQGVSSGKWVCDLGRQMIYMRRITWSRGRKGDWDGFVAEAKRRMAMPACEGKIKTAGQNVWFRPKGVTVDEFRFCETCYTDAFADSKWEDVFEKVVETSKTEWTMHKCAWKWNLPVTQFTFAVQTTKQPADDLRLGLAVIAGKPRCCTREGIKGGRFYNLRNAVSEFGVCEACYEGFVRAVGMASFFSDIPVTIPQAAYCVFNTFLDRWGQFIERYNEALDTGRFSAYEDAVRKWIDIRGCSRQVAVAKRVWYGWPECPVCLDCFETFVAGTTLAGSMPMQKKYLEEETACCMYSFKQRKRYQEACAKNDVSELLATSRERHAVWLETIPVLKMMKERVDAELDAANVQVQISANHMAADSMGCVFGSNTYVYSAEGGYGYKSWDGVLSEQAWNSAMAMRQRAANPQRIMEMRRLEDKWAEYE